MLPNKGFDRLLKIHKRLINEGFNIHTYILGIGSEEEKLKKYIQQNNLQESCTLLGYKINPYKYVARCDLFTCMSFAEGFSTAATESLIVGTPVLTTDVAGMREMLGNHNEYGIVVENNDDTFYKTLKRLIKDKDLLNYYTHQANIRGQYFSTENTVRAVEKILK